MKIYGNQLIIIFMRRHLKKIRKSIITKEEIIADAIFLFISAFISFLLVFFFDIHQSFYEWPIVLNKEFHWCFTSGLKH